MKEIIQFVFGHLLFHFFSKREQEQDYYSQWATGHKPALHRDLMTLCLMTSQRM